MDGLTLDQGVALLRIWGGQLAWAAAITLMGLMMARWSERAVEAALGRVKLGDAMLKGFFASLVRWGVLVVAGLAALEKLGVQTTSVVAMLGAAGLAIGLALQNTLSNLAAGIMLLLFRPFHVGDSIECGPLAGSVRAMSLFHTDLVSADNILVIAPNSVLWGAALRNLSALPRRRLVLTVPVPFPADVDQAMGRARALVAADSRVVAEPAPGVALARFVEKAAEIEVAVWCATADAGALKGDLLAALWRECLKDVV
jgi:small conductance mechanosensitive channel